MPFARGILRAPTVAVVALGRFARALLWIALIGIGIFALLLLLVRMVLFPHIERYRDAITAAISAQVHQPVALDTLTTGWDGWNPKLVIDGFRIGAPATAGAAPVLELPRVELTVSWTSVPLFELRLKQLLIESPRLAVRRDANGVVHLAGIAFDPQEYTDDAGISDWLLRQREIVVRNALITWTDERRNAPQLVLDGVNFRLESRFGRRRFGLTGSPPTELATPIDVRGDVVASSVRDWQQASGQVYVRLDYADVAAWREWLPLPLEIDSGKGALRAWFTFVQGEAREVIADLELADVRTRLQPELPELALAHVAGRVGWRFARPTREVFSRQLAFTTADGLSFEPTNLAVMLHADAQGAPEQGRLEFDRLQLAPLQAIAAYVPLPERWRAELRAFAPRGTISRGLVQWEGAVEAPTRFNATAELAEFGVAPHGDWPGVTNVAGTLRASDAAGELRLAARDARLELPRVFARPISLETVRADVAWTRDAAGRVSLHIKDASFANADAAGKFQATYRALEHGPGEIALDATLTRASVAAVPRYTPIFLSPGVQGWLADAVKPGNINEARVRLKGDLAAFPFADGKAGILDVTIKGHNFGLAYAEGWPAFSAIDGELHVQNAALRVVSSRGVVYGVQLGKVTASIADLRAPVLDVQGEALGPAQDFLRFIEESPVAEWIGHFTRGAEAAGESRLALKLSLPLNEREKYHVSGDFTFLNDQLKLVAGPPLTAVSGQITFTEKELRARDVVAEAFGGPVRLSVTTGEGRLRVAASGNATVEAVRREFPFPFADHATGAADWTFALDARGDTSTWTVESPLKGVRIDLPPPLRKLAADTLPMRVERRPVAGSTDEDLLTGRLGDVAQWAAYRRIAAGNTGIDRALLVLGRTARPVSAPPAQRGLWVRAELPALDIDQWLAVERPAGAAAAGTDDLVLSGIDLDIATLTVFGRDFTALKVNGRHPQEDWVLDLAGEQIAGRATWSARSEKRPNGRVVARLARLALPPAKPVTATAATPGDGGAGAWPELDIAADAFNSKGRDLGRMELLAQPRAGEWRIERLSIANDTGRMDASGAWRAGARPEETRVDVALDVKEAGGFLARFGHPGAVQGAPTKISGQLAWAGDPSEFDYPTLSGQLKIDVGSGRFMKIEPGIGKLLGVLSLQALPRRISLDFRDIFSEGFTFDRVTGTVRIARGVISTSDLRLVGPSAQVVIAGDADLAQETQQLRVRVQPTLSAGVSAGAALLFLANPVVGAAIGAGSLLAQKALRDPIEQMFSYEYSISGSWSDPQVTRGGTARVAGPVESSVK